MIDMPPSNVETGNTGAAVTRGKSHADRASAQRRWRLHLGLLIVLVILIAAAYWSTLTGIVSIWIRSETFAHGFVIFPIVAWLIYRIRDELAGFEPRIGWLGLPMLPDESPASKSETLMHALYKGMIGPYAALGVLFYLVFKHTEKKDLP